ncbi:MAG: exodeoxyribonuclease VII large subunit [Myxococcota bacterium]
MQQGVPGASPRQAAWSVFQLTLEIKRRIEADFSGLAVEGEISNCRRASSGHVYFTLKDDRSQLPCVLWRSTVRRLGMDPRDGMQVTAWGDVQVYPPHGRYQLIVRRMRESGLGQLLARLEALKRRLAAEGLFAEERKRPLPFMPRRVGVVTAGTGAAVRDILTTVFRRYPARVLLYPCKVQGPGAAEGIARGIALLDRQPEVDVIVVGRGGGSVEDLWAFNEEVVVRAIAACSTPVVSAVGHEIDMPLSDFVADQRAATPTAAGECVVPSLEELRQTLGLQVDRMERVVRQRIRDGHVALEQRATRLADPRRVVAERRQRLDDLTSAMEAAVGRRLAAGRERRAGLSGRLHNLHPRQRLRAARQQLSALERRLHAAGPAALRDRRRALGDARNALRVLSPIGSLERGYAIVRDDEGRVVRDAHAVREGAGLEVILHRGGLDVAVERVKERNPFEPREDS